MSGAEDSKDGHGLKLEKVEPTRKYPIRLGSLKRPPSIRGHLIFAFLVLFYVEVIESLISVSVQVSLDVQPSQTTAPVSSAAASCKRFFL